MNELLILLILCDLLVRIFCIKKRTNKQIDRNNLLLDLLTQEDDNLIEIKGKGFTKEGLEFYCQFYHKDINDICFEKINLKYNIITKDNLIHVNKLNQVKKNYQKKIKRILLEQGNKENNIEFICGLLKICSRF